MSQTITSQDHAASDRGQGAASHSNESWFAWGYRIFAYFGLMSVFAALI